MSDKYFFEKTIIEEGVQIPKRERLRLLEIDRANRNLRLRSVTPQMSSS